MKNFYPIFLMLIFTFDAVSQAPEGMSYQAVIRNSASELVIEQNVAIQISILQGSASGSAVYKETHNAVTNGNGLVSLMIGGGTPVLSTFSGINWAEGPYFAMIEADPGNSGTYSIVTTSQLLSVPYALYAKSAGNVTGGGSGDAMGLTDVLLHNNSANGMTITDLGAPLAISDAANKGYVDELHNRINNLMEWFASLNVSGEPLVITHKTEDVTYESVTLKGEIVNTGGSDIGFRFFILGYDENLSLDNYYGTVNGNIVDGNFFSATMQNLDPETKYFVRAVAENSNNMLGMGEVISFTTLIKDLPTFSSEGYIPSPYSVYIKATISDSGTSDVIQKGVVWSSEPDPTVDNNEGITEEGPGIGEFETSMTGLQQNSTYYFRVYAVNDSGVEYGYQFAIVTPADPDTPEGLTVISSDLLRKWFITIHNFNSPALALWVTADAGSSPWGNFGMGHLNREPREEFNNTTTSNYRAITHNYYNNLSYILREANKVIDRIENNNMQIIDNDLDITDMAIAVAYFTQGLATGYLGLVYDQAFIFDHNTPDPLVVNSAEWQAVIDAALSAFDQAITIAGNSQFTLPYSWLPLNESVDQELFGKLVNSFAARVLAYSPRNSQQNSSVDWNRVLQYADNGIDFDFAPISDGSKWFSHYHYYGSMPLWTQTDMRIVNMMDPDMPVKFNDFDDLQVQLPYKNDPAEVYDDRLLTDFNPVYRRDFFPYYFNSAYEYLRRFEYVESKMTGPTPDFYKAENDLLLAEALYQTEQYTDAASIINAGTRVSRGGMPAISDDPEEIRAAIFHERNIELHNSGFGVEFFTMRKADKLQQGTILHLPLPGSLLEQKGLNYYTFGGSTGVPGVDVSNGGWE